MLQELQRLPIERLGVDIGRVITRESTDESEASLFDSARFLDSLPNDGAIETIREASRQRFGKEVYLISKCGPAVEARSREWLQHINFYDRTGVSADKVYFCRKRSEKGVIAASLLLTHFIDDREDVLHGMPPSVKHKILFNPANTFPDQPPVFKDAWFEVVQGWKGVAATLDLRSAA